MAGCCAAGHLHCRPQGWRAAAAGPRRVAAPTRAHLTSVLSCIPAPPACLQNNYQAESNTCLMGDTFKELVTHADEAFKWINEGTDAVCAACTAALMLPVCACCTCCQRHQCLLPPLPVLLAQSPACPPACRPACLLLPQKPKWGYVSEQVGSTLQFSVKTKVVSKDKLLHRSWASASLHQHFKSPRLPASLPARLLLPRA